MSVKKYFIAIVIPAPLQERIEGIKDELFTVHGLKGGLRSPAHITLHRPFEWKEEKEDLLVNTLKQFDFSQKIEISLNGFAFFEPRVIYADVIKNDMLFELHKQLKQFAAKELKLLNEVNDERGFHPHVTVASRDLKKPLFYKLQKEFKQALFEGSFSYDGFSVLKLEKRWEELFHFKMK